MYLSKFFFRSKRKSISNSPETAYEKMLRASMIFQNASGFYTYLPLGLRILKNLENWIIEEMEAIGFSHIRIPFLISTTLLEKSDRLNMFGKNIFYTQDYKARPFILGATYEESIASIFKSYISSYRDFPINVFQIGTKFRNEYRAKFGLVRTMEFVMKDAYSLYLSEEDNNQTYELMRITYKKIFDKCNLNIKIVSGYSGVMGGISEEFMFNTSLGEDYIAICQDCGFAENIENHMQGKKTLEKLEKITYTCIQCKSKGIDFTQVLELGHIFKLSNRYLEAENLLYLDKNSQKVIPSMNSYGIGISRLLSTIIDHSPEDKIILPFHLSPFHVIIISLNMGDQEVKDSSFSLYEKLEGRIVGKNFKMSVLLDDRDLGPSIKFKDADLMGIPIHIIIGKKELMKKEVQVNISLLKADFSKNFPIENIEKVIDEICKEYI